MMKIVLTANRFFSIANSRKKIIESLLKEGNEVTIIAEFDGFEKDILGISSQKLKCIDFIFSPATQSISKLFQFYRLLKQVQPQVVHAFNPLPVFFSAIIKKHYKKSNYKLIVTITGLGAPYGQKSKSILVYDQFYKLAFKAADKTIFQNKEDAQYFEKKLPNEVMKKIEVITGSGVDVNRFHKTKHSHYEENEFNIIFISRLIKHKGVTTVLELSKKLLEENVKINIFGEYLPQHTYTISEAEFQYLKNADNICYRGFVKNIEEEFLKNDLLICCSSKGEGVPRVLLEASASGLPIVAFNAPGVNEAIVDQETGFLVSDIDAFVNKILLLKNDNELYKKMSLKSREFITQNFTQDLILEKYLKVYNQIMSKINKVE